MQSATARSTCEAEFISLSHVAQEAVYLSQLVRSMRIPVHDMPIHVNQGPHNSETAYQVWKSYMDKAHVSEYMQQPAMLWSDSSNAITNARTPFGWLQNKLRHIKTAFHFLKQYVLPNDYGARLKLQPVSQVTDPKMFQLDHVRGEDNPADIFTKGFGDKKTKGNNKADVFERHAKFCLGVR